MRGALDQRSGGRLVDTRTAMARRFKGTTLAASIGGAPIWTPAGEAITLQNVQQIRHLGRLESPAPPSTIFDYALSPDSTRLVALNNDTLSAWDLVSGEMVFSTSRSGRGDSTCGHFSPTSHTAHRLFTPGVEAGRITHRWRRQ